MPLWGITQHTTTRCIMKNAIAVLSTTAMLVLSCIGQTVDTYSFKMNLKVPRIYNNGESLGYRKLEPQKLVGELQFIYNDDGSVNVKVNKLENRTHKENGVPILYTCYDFPYENHNPLVVGIGSNKTGKFKQGGAEFAFQADPSYNIGGLDEDNTLMLELAGYGSLNGDVLKNLRGSVKGQIGCGCRAYGHVSPTRLFLGWLTGIVWDIAPVYGTFSAKFMGRRTVK